MKTVYRYHRTGVLHMLSVFMLMTTVLINYLLITGWEEIVNNTEDIKFNIFLFILLLMMGNALFFSFIYLHGRFILEIKREKDVLEIKTWSLFGAYKIRPYPLDIIYSSRYYEGKYETARGILGRTPYLKLKDARKKSLILDLNGEFPDRQFNKLFPIF